MPQCPTTERESCFPLCVFQGPWTKQTELTQGKKSLHLHTHSPELQAPTCKISPVHVTFPLSWFQQHSFNPLEFLKSASPPQAQPREEITPQEFSSPFAGWGVQGWSLKGCEELKSGADSRLSSSFSSINRAGLVEYKSQGCIRLVGLSRRQASMAGLQKPEEVSEDLRAENRSLHSAQGRVQGEAGMTVQGGNCSLLQTRVSAGREGACHLPPHISSCWTQKKKAGGSRTA